MARIMSFSSPGKHVDDPVDRLGGRRRVERAEDQVARLGGGHGQADGLQVAHFSYQDGVGVLAQRRAQRRGERQRHRPDLALIDQALLGLVHELDRILHREDVAVFGLVEVVDHRRQGGRLARAGRPGHQHQAARPQGEFAEDPGRAELLQRQDLRRDGPEHRRRATALVEGIDPEARQTVDLEGEIDLQEFLVMLAVRVAHDVVHHGVHRLVVQRLDIDAPHVAMDADHRRQPGRQVQVGGLVLHAESQQLGDVHESPCDVLIRVCKL
jgi:hypothetical protein